jgi:hypothetical protein
MLSGGSGSLWQVLAGKFPLALERAGKFSQRLIDFVRPGRRSEIYNRHTEVHRLIGVEEWARAVAYSSRPKPRKPAGADRINLVRYDRPYANFEANRAALTRNRPLSGKRHNGDS